MRAIFLTPHYWSSRRKAGMHWLADALRRRGWEILFLTEGMSWPLWIRRQDWRLEYPVREEANRLVPKETGVTSFVWVTPWHPAKLGSRLLDRLAAPLYRQYPRFAFGPAEPVIRDADLMVFESSAALLLFPRLTALARGARTVYRISDDMRLLRYHPVIEEAEAASVDAFDLLSIPSRAVFKRHEHRRHARFHPQGIRKDLFDAPAPNPYAGVRHAGDPEAGDLEATGATPGGRNSRVRAVFVGNSHLDRDFLRTAATLKPDWQFHVIGSLPDLPGSDNIIAYGEMPFEETIAYLQHADIGLNIRSVEPGAACLAESLKVIQYTYCGLPIVAPEALRTAGNHLAYYTPGDAASIERALDEATAMMGEDVDRSWVKSWDEVADALLGDLGLAEGSRAR